MRKNVIFQAVLVLVFLFTVQLTAADKPTPSEPTSVKEKPLSPMMQEITAVMESNAAAVASLQIQLTSTVDEEEALQILRTISQHHQESEIKILRIQERYARQAGDNETAEKINQAVEKILHPDPMTPSPEAMAERAARRSGGSDHD